jgi:hypothetical protein
VGLDRVLDIVGNPYTDKYVMTAGFHDAYNATDENCLRPPTPYRKDDEEKGQPEDQQP